eukprot:Gregarina_sp_Poly_1__10679@NODE_807_length_6221_cov_56_782580_g588_i0_p1_GENE_NODE_807_length_6221_cov_56_782580_g588_i0NODE_807_length_6221_cov_56_782580_g588_i0_p1_ORF_typecomplete_len1179_score177_24NAD_binding_4/PF07993_12/7_2e45AMPbinding/PF00501_28/4e35PPbinding/PF00550_25/2_6PPbinding/PF00550_25/1_5e06Epimerase/PF01370_21/5_2e093Beta_HSD/PF01073_19/0_00051RmlD_sub_bind/PF04321_17/19RmlD_sub_bind/PF04321_17/0_043GDP_Man_Dehyd/PF16363_5/0_026DUF3098/PF11297_8/0_18_NODE_807_length_6221_cov_5
MQDDKIAAISSQLAHVTSWADFLRDSPIDVRDHPSLLHMLKYHVDKAPDKILMYWPVNNYRSFVLLTARDVWDLGDRYYAKFKNEIIPGLKARSWVAVLLEDNGHNWWTVLALLRADMNILMITYKQSVASIQNLMDKTGAVTLITTPRLAKSILKDLDEGHSFQVIVTQRQELETVREWPTSNEEIRPPGPNELEEARICLHSSGSTRLPSPIYLLNSRIITDCILMYVTQMKTFQENEDLLRTLVLAPTAHLMGFTYIVAATMILGFTSVLALSPRFPPSVPEILHTIELGNVKRLVTVPAILETIILSLPDSSPQWKVMQQLDSITFGGAPLPRHLGNKFKAKGIKVGSGYGSTEGGINMVSSDEDGDPTALSMLPFASWKFIPQDGNETTATVFELVILKNSFSLAPGVANCDEGFATSDLFRRGKRPGEWHHVGRKGDTLVHINGEKTNAALMEEAILNHAQGKIFRASVLGSGRSSTALLVEPNWDMVDLNASEDELYAIALQAARAANRISPQHSRILPDKIKVLTRDQHIPTSEKGNIQRFKVMQIFEKEIEELYNPKRPGGARKYSHKRHKSTELTQAVSTTLATALDIKPEEVFKTDEPVPSTEKARLASELEEVVGSPLSIDIINEHTTPQDLLQFLISHYAVDADVSISPEHTNSLSELAELLAGVLEMDKYELEAKKNESLLDLGLTSLEAESLQHIVETKFQIELPSNFVYEYSTLNDLHKGLASYLSAEKFPLHPASPRDEDPFHYKETSSLQKKYCNLISDVSCVFKQEIQKNLMKAVCRERRVIAITGASGHLGVHLVKKAIENSKFSRVVCFLRGKELKTRMKESFASRFLDPELLEDSRIEFMAYNPRDSMLGLTEEVYINLQNQVTDVVHNAWKVDFNIRVRDYEAEWIKSVWYLILFCVSGPMRKSLNFISSVSAIANYQNSDFIPEEFMGDEQVFMTLPMGYGQSKFIAESMLHRAKADLGLTARIFRCGQICGDTQNGVWKQQEMVPIVTVKGGGELKMIPENFHEGNLIPVDIAGGSIIEIIADDHERLVFHMTNPKGGSWQDWMDALQEAGLEFDRVDGYQFLRVSFIDTDLLNFFLQAIKEHPKNECNLLYGVLEGFLAVPKSVHRPALGSAGTEEASTILKSCPNLNSELAGKFLNYWRSTGFLALQKRET